MGSPFWGRLPPALTQTQPLEHHKEPPPKKEGVTARLEHRGLLKRKPHWRTTATLEHEEKTHVQLSLLDEGVEELHKSLVLAVLWLGHPEARSVRANGKFGGGVWD